MDSFSEQLRKTGTSRQVKLRMFLMEHGIKVKNLAAQRGISPGGMGDVFSGRRPNADHIEWLISMGIPAELLPSPVAPKKRGPKPKHATGSGEASQEQAA